MQKYEKKVFDGDSKRDDIVDKCVCVCLSTRVFSLGVHEIGAEITANTANIVGIESNRIKRHPVSIDLILHAEIVIFSL